MQKKPQSVVRKYLEEGYPVEAAHTKAAKIAHGVARMNEDSMRRHSKHEETLLLQRTRSEFGET